MKSCFSIFLSDEELHVREYAPRNSAVRELTCPMTGSYAAPTMSHTVVRRRLLNSMFSPALCGGSAGAAGELARLMLR